LFNHFCKQYERHDELYVTLFDLKGENEVRYWF